MVRTMRKYGSVCYAIGQKKQWPANHPPWILASGCTGGFCTILSTSARFLSSAGRSQTEVRLLGLKKKTRPSPVHTTHQGVPGTGVLDTGRDLSWGRGGGRFAAAG